MTMMKIITNPYGDKGGQLISDFIHGQVLSMRPGESREVDEEFSYKVKMLYPFIIIEDVKEAQKEEAEAPNPLFNGEKKQKKRLFNL